MVRTLTDAPSDGDSQADTCNDPGGSAQRPKALRELWMADSFVLGSAVPPSSRIYRFRARTVTPTSPGASSQKKSRPPEVEKIVRAALRVGPDAQPTRTAYSMYYGRAVTRITARRKGLSYRRGESRPSLRLRAGWGGSLPATICCLRPTACKIASLRQIFQPSIVGRGRMAAMPLPERRISELAIGCLNTSHDPSY